MPVHYQPPCNEEEQKHFKINLNGEYKKKQSKDRCILKYVDKLPNYAHSHPVLLDSNQGPLVEDRPDERIHLGHVAAEPKGPTANPSEEQDHLDQAGKDLIRGMSRIDVFEGFAIIFRGFICRRKKHHFRSAFRGRASNPTARKNVRNQVRIPAIRLESGVSKELI